MPVRGWTFGMAALAVLLVALAAWTTVRQTRPQLHLPYGDFSYLHSGTECLVDRCDPYDSTALNRAALRRHEPKPSVWPMSPVYPPGTLLLLAPFARLEWPGAAFAFVRLAGLATMIACTLLVWSLRLEVRGPWTLPLATGLLCHPTAYAMQFGNPALLATALATTACLLLLAPAKEHDGSARWLGALSLGAALTLKPQLAVGAVLVLLARRESRSPAIKACVVALLLLVAGTAAYGLRLGSFDFLTTFRRTLSLATQPGGAADFSSVNDEAFDFLNLQPALDHLPGITRTLTSALAWSTALLLTAAALWMGLRRSLARSRPWTLIALAVAISLLPVYHRGYDRVIALLLIPAALELWQRSRIYAWAYCTVLTIWLANDTWMAHIGKRWQSTAQNGPEGLLLSLLLLASLWSTGRSEHPLALGTIEA